MDASILYKEMGTLIRRRRRALDLTQEKLAGRLGISRGALANIETGRQNVLVHQLYRFAAALDMDVQALLPVFPDDDISVRTNELPLPEGLTVEQKGQVARLFTGATQRRGHAE
jgi:transcriptional regulator with XRE-family HTH domain